MVEEWLNVLGSGDLKMKILREGEPGTRPQNFDIATINLKGELEDGTIVEEEQELKVEVNGSEVIQALDLVLPLLEVGQQVTAIVKPRFGYGSAGLPPKIPPQATIIYTVELLSVLIPPELTNTPFDDRKKKADFTQTKGNWWYERGNYDKAVMSYCSGIKVLHESTPFIDETEMVTDMPEDLFKDFEKQRLVLYNNLASALRKLEAYDCAMLSVEDVLKVDPKNIKALNHLGRILQNTGNTDGAVEALRKAVALDPNNIYLKRALNLALKKLTLEKLKSHALKMENAAAGVYCTPVPVTSCLCGKGFPSTKKLRNHQKSCPIAIAGLPPPPPPPRLNHRCDRTGCPRSFATHVGLLRHQRQGHPEGDAATVRRKGRVIFWTEAKLREVAKVDVALTKSGTLVKKERAASIGRLHGLATSTIENRMRTRRYKSILTETRTQSSTTSNPRRRRHSPPSQSQRPTPQQSFAGLSSSKGNLPLKPRSLPTRRLPQASTSTTGNSPRVLRRKEPGSKSPAKTNKKPS